MPRAADEPRTSPGAYSRCKPRQTESGAFTDGAAGEHGAGVPHALITKARAATAILFIEFHRIDRALHSIPKRQTIGGQYSLERRTTPSAREISPR